MRDKGLFATTAGREESGALRRFHATNNYAVRLIRMQHWGADRRWRSRRGMTMESVVAFAQTQDVASLQGAGWRPAISDCGLMERSAPAKYAKQSQTWARWGTSEDVQASGVHATPYNRWCETRPPTAEWIAISLFQKEGYALLHDDAKQSQLVPFLVETQCLASRVYRRDQCIRCKETQNVASLQRADRAKQSQRIRRVCL